MTSPACSCYWCTETEPPKGLIGRLQYWARHTMFVEESPPLTSQAAALVVDVVLWRWYKLRDRITRRDIRRG